MYYKDLEVWKESIKLFKIIYTITNSFPLHELYGLTSQIRRASISTPSNIVEGMSRFSDNDKCRFIDIALGSLAEIETQLIISKELDYIDNAINQLNKVNALAIGLS